MNSKQRKKSYGSLPCSVVGCKNTFKNSPTLHFYTFATSLSRRLQTEQWVKAINRINPDKSPWQPKKHNRICSAHFIGNCKSNHPLSPSYVPTIFPKEYGKNPLSESAIKNATKRFERACKRQMQMNNTVDVDNIDIDQTVDAENQVDFLEMEENRDTNMVMLMSNRYVNGMVCDAETQTNISFAIKLKFIKKATADKCCGIMTIIKPRENPKAILYDSQNAL